MSTKSPFRVVVAIDFGTSRTGYAYAFTNEEKIYVKTDWPAQPEPYPKTLTQVLYSPEKTLAAWGYEARSRYLDVRRQPDAKKYDFFANFKMKLHSTKNYNSEGPKLTGTSGNTFLVRDIIADFLNVIKTEALKEITRNTSGMLKDNEILWCLTIPAIWKDVDKQIMRQAAQQAGLIGTDSNEEGRLILVLEPEAATLQCRRKAQVKLDIGSRVMIVDCGGGTVDITVHEILTNNQLKELAPGSGGAYGSMHVDLEFMGYLKERLTSDVMDKFVAEYPIENLQILADWERQKCHYNPVSNKDDIYIPIPVKLYNLLRNEFSTVYRNLTSQQDGDDEYIHIDKNRMTQLFKPVVDGIVHLVYEQFKGLDRQQCDYIFLVGGFAASPLLENRLRTEFGSKVKNILIPPMPGSAVVEGAVYFGLQQDSFLRKLRRTYGCATRMTFREGIDDINKREKIFDKARREYKCEDRFDIFVRKGESVDTNQSVTRTYVPVFPDQVAMDLRFYTTDNVLPNYVDEAGVSQIGNIRVSMPDTTGGINRAVDVTMYFGGTEINVEAKDQTSGKVYTAQLKYDPIPSSSTQVDIEAFLREFLRK